MATRLGLYGGPSGGYGDFSGKSAGTGPTKLGEITRLGILGTPLEKYGDFSPQTTGTVGAKVGDITRLGLYGGPRFQYGDFSGKTEGEDAQVKGGGRDRRKLTPSQAKLRRIVDKVHLEELLPDDITKTTKEVLLTGKVDVDGTEVIVGDFPTPSVLALAPIPSLQEEIGSLERVIEEDLQREFKLKQAQAILEFQEDIRKFEEEFLLFLILINE